MRFVNMRVLLQLKLVHRGEHACIFQVMPLPRLHGCLYLFPTALLGNQNNLQVLVRTQDNFLRRTQEHVEE